MSECGDCQHLVNLPPELWVRIFSDLNLRELGNAEKVARGWRNFIRSFALQILHAGLLKYLFQFRILVLPVRPALAPLSLPLSLTPLVALISPDYSHPLGHRLRCGSVRWTYSGVKIKIR